MSLGALQGLPRKRRSDDSPSIEKEPQQQKLGSDQGQIQQVMVEDSADRSDRRKTYVSKDIRVRRATRGAWCCGCKAECKVTRGEDSPCFEGEGELCCASCGHHRCAVCVLLTDTKLRGRHRIAE